MPSKILIFVTNFSLPSSQSISLGISFLYFLHSLFLTSSRTTNTGPSAARTTRPLSARGKRGASRRTKLRCAPATWRRRTSRSRARWTISRRRTRSSSRWWQRSKTSWISWSRTDKIPYEKQSGVTQWEGALLSCFFCLTCGVWMRERDITVSGSERRVRAHGCVTWSGSERHVKERISSDPEVGDTWEITSIEAAA